MEQLIFLYGTLRPGHAPPEIADAVSRLRQIGPGTIRGRLYNLGAYPGVVLDDGAAEVPGQVFAVPDGETLTRMDAYEGYYPDNSAASLFLRVRVMVSLAGGASESCWVYIYNGPLPGS
jgi:gamma-glutamylcyclotransferase (GGCT)/AIG2-like uncharacterized protein YtfP